MKRLPRIYKAFPILEMMAQLFCFIWPCPEYLRRRAHCSIQSNGRGCGRHFRATVHILLAKYKFVSEESARDILEDPAHFGGMKCILIDRVHSQASAGFSRGGQGIKKRGFTHECLSDENIMTKEARTAQAARNSRIRSLARCGSINLPSPIRYGRIGRHQLQLTHRYLGTAN